MKQTWAIVRRSIHSFSTHSRTVVREGMSRVRMLWGKCAESSDTAVASAAPVGPAKVKEAEPDQVPSAITEPERDGVGLDQVWDEMR